MDEQTKPSLDEIFANQSQQDQPSLDGIFGQQAPIEQPRSDWDAFKYGMKNNITSNLVHGLERTTGITLPEIVSVPEGYKPETLEEHAASLVGSLFDPVTLAVPMGKGVDLAAHLAKTAIAGGLIGAGQAASEQFAQGQYSVADIVKSGAFGTAFGAGLGGLTRLFPSSKAGIVEQGAMRQLFEKPEVRALASVGEKERANIVEITKLNREGYLAQKEFDKVQAIALDDTLPAGRRQSARFAMEKQNLELESINSEMAYYKSSKEYKILSDAQESILTQLGTDQEGKVYDILDNLVSSKNKLLDPKFMVEASYAGDTSARAANAWGFSDISRIFEKVDKSARGWFKQHFHEPAIEKLTQKEAEEVSLLKNYESVVKALPDQSKLRRSELVDILEGKADKLKTHTTIEEDSWLNWMRENFSNLRNRINEVRIRNGLNPIGKIDQYFPHAEQLDLLTQWGLKNPQELKPLVTGLQKKEITSPFFKKRSGGGDYIKDSPDEIVKRYIGNALNSIHMTDVASELQAKSAALLNSPNMRSTIDRWINSAVMRGLDPKDQSFIQNGFENALKAIGKATNLYSAGVLMGNIGIVAQQPSQILATVMTSGLGSTLKGVAKLFSPHAAEIEKASQFLSNRAFRSELPSFNKGMLSKYTNFLSAVTGWADQGVARATWHAAFDKAKLNNLSDKAAVRYADFLAQKLHASYNEINKPSILRGKVGKAFFPFQTFTFNLWNLIVRDNKIMGELQGINKYHQFANMVGSLYATNLIYKSLNLPEPFEILGVPTQVGTLGLPPIPLIGSSRGGIPSPILNIPYKEFQGALGLASGDTDKIQGTLFGNLLRAAFTDDEEDRQKAILDMGKFGMKFVASGQQLANAAEGLMAVQRGSIKKGKEDIDIESPIIATLFGPRKTREYKSAVDEDKRMRVRRILGLEP